MLNTGPDSDLLDSLYHQLHYVNVKNGCDRRISHILRKITGVTAYPSADASSRGYTAFLKGCSISNKAHLLHLMAATAPDQSTLYERCKQ